MIWLMEVLSICLAEQLLIKYYVLKDLIFLKIQNLMVIKVVVQWFTTFLKKKYSFQGVTHAHKSPIIKEIMKKQSPLDLDCVAKVSDFTRNLSGKLIIKNLEKR